MTTSDGTKTFTRNGKKKNRKKYRWHRMKIRNWSNLRFYFQPEGNFLAAKSNRKLCLNGNVRFWFLRFSSIHFLSTSSFQLSSRMSIFLRFLFSASVPSSLSSLSTILTFVFFLLFFCHLCFTCSTLLSLVLTFRFFSFVVFRLFFHSFFCTITIDVFISNPLISKR